MSRIVQIVSACAVASLLLTALLPDMAAAQPAWPERQVRMLVNFPPGTAIDSGARIIADALGKRWGKPVIVENRAGAEGTLGIREFVGTTDNHTLLYSVAAAVTVVPLLIDRLPYDPQRDLIPIVATSSAVVTVAVTRDLPAQSLAELVQLARKEPGRLSWTSGPTLPRYAFAAFLKHNNLSMTYVNYREASQPQADLSEGRIHVLVTSLQASLGAVQTGKARFLAVTNAARVAAIADVPTAHEAGHPELAFNGLAGVFGWRGMPENLRRRIADDVSSALQEASVRARIEGSGQVILGGTPADFQAAIAEQRARINELAALIDLKDAR